HHGQTPPPGLFPPAQKLRVRQDLRTLGVRNSHAACSGGPVVIGGRPRSAGEPLPPRVSGGPGPARGAVPPAPPPPGPPPPPPRRDRSPPPASPPRSPPRCRR